MIIPSWVVMVWYIRKWDRLCPKYALHCTADGPPGLSIAILVQYVDATKLSSGDSSSLIASDYRSTLFDSLLVDRHETF